MKNVLTKNKFNDYTGLVFISKKEGKMINKLCAGMKVKALKDINILLKGKASSVVEKAFTEGNIYVVRRLENQPSRDKRWFVTDDRDDPRDPHEISLEYVRENFEEIE